MKNIFLISLTLFYCTIAMGQKPDKCGYLNALAEGNITLAKERILKLCGDISGPDCDKVLKQCTPLPYKRIFKSPQAVKTLEEHHFNINEEDTFGHTTLYNEVDSCQAEDVLMLRLFGADQKLEPSQKEKYVKLANDRRLSYFNNRFYKNDKEKLSTAQTQCEKTKWVLKLDLNSIIDNINNGKLNLVHQLLSSKFSDNCEPEYFKGLVHRLMIINHVSAEEAKFDEKYVREVKHCEAAKDSSGAEIADELKRDRYNEVTRDSEVERIMMGLLQLKQDSAGIYKVEDNNDAKKSRTGQ